MISREPHEEGWPAAAAFLWRQVNSEIQFALDTARGNKSQFLKWFALSFMGLFILMAAAFTSAFYFYEWSLLAPDWNVLLLSSLVLLGTTGYDAIFDRSDYEQTRPFLPWVKWGWMVLMGFAYGVIVAELAPGVRLHWLVRMSLSVGLSWLAVLWALRLWSQKAHASLEAATKERSRQEKESSDSETELAEEFDKMMEDFDEF